MFYLGEAVRAISKRKGKLHGIGGHPDAAAFAVFELAVPLFALCVSLSCAG